jgi:hypothetical protein
VKYECNELLNNELWNKFDEELGIITDFKIVIEPNINNNHFAQIRFKSNGIDKIIYCNDANFKFFIVASYYCSYLASPIRRYKHSVSNFQHSL